MGTLQDLIDVLQEWGILLKDVGIPANLEEADPEQLRALENALEFWSEHGEDVDEDEIEDN